MQFIRQSRCVRCYSSYTKIRDLSEKLIGSPIQIKVIGRTDEYFLYLNLTITILQGWIKAQRIMKERSFVDVNDGSTHQNLQIVIAKDEHKKPGHASSVYAKGILSQTPKGQLELIADDFQVISMECFERNTNRHLSQIRFQINVRLTSFHSWLEKRIHLIIYASTCTYDLG